MVHRSDPGSRVNSAWPTSLWSNTGFVHSTTARASASSITQVQVAKDGSPESDSMNGFGRASASRLSDAG